MKKIFFALCFFTAMGCHNHIPRKVYEDPHMYVFDIWIESEWDKTYPVRTWESKIELGKTYKGWNGISYAFSMNPEDSTQIIIKCKPLDR